MAGQAPCRMQDRDLVRAVLAGLATRWKSLSRLRLRWGLALPRSEPPASPETAMKFRWSEWLTAAALVFAFSAFAGAEAAEQVAVEASAR